MCILFVLFGTVLFVQCFGLTTVSPDDENAFFGNLLFQCDDPHYWLLDWVGQLWHDGHKKVNCYASITNDFPVSVILQFELQNSRLAMAVTNYSGQFSLPHPLYSVTFFVLFWHTEFHLQKNPSESKFVLVNAKGNEESRILRCYKLMAFVLILLK